MCLVRDSTMVRISARSSGPVSRSPAARHCWTAPSQPARLKRSEEHTSELQSLTNLVCRLLLEKKNKNRTNYGATNLPDRTGTIPKTTLIIKLIDGIHIGKISLLNNVDQKEDMRRIITRNSTA